MEYLLPRLSVELILFAIPVLLLFLIVLQFGFVHRLDEHSGITQMGFAVALLILLLSPVFIMARGVIYAIHPDMFQAYRVDMLVLFLVWGGLFYTLVNISNRMKPSKMIFMQRASAVFSSLFAVMYIGPIFSAS